MSLQDLIRNNYRMQPDPETDPNAPTPETEEEKEERAQLDTQMLYKRLEKYFFQTRSIYLWGIVDDKSAKDVVTKLMLLEADKPGEDDLVQLAFQLAYLFHSDLDICGLATNRTAGLVHHHTSML